jgi:hypothetical protein
MASPIIVPPNAQVLQNKGFQFYVHRLKRDEHGTILKPYERVYDETDKPVYDMLWFKLTNAELAAIEEMNPVGFGSIEGWEEMLGKQTFKTIAKTVAIFLDEYTPDATGIPVPNVRLAATMLIDGKIADYVIAVSNAMLLSQGVSPEAVGESVKRSLAEARKGEKEATAKMLAMFAKDDDAANDTQTPQSTDSPSQTGLPDGAPSDEMQMSSGV